MGHNIGTIHEIERLRTDVLDHQSPALFDLGSQDVFFSTQEEIDRMCALIADRGGDTGRFLSEVGERVPASCPAGVVFANLGYEYACCDVDRRPGTVYLDFNALPDVGHLFGKFDFVVNSGTTEHVLSSAHAFFYMHNLATVGGILYNNVPMFGMGNHGIINHTPKFWHTLHWMNQYQLIEAQISRSDEATLDRSAVFGDHLKKFNGLEELSDISCMAKVIFRKHKDTMFIPPMDAVIDPADDGSALGVILAGSLRTFVLANLMTAQTALTGVNQFLEYNAKPYRFQPGECDDLFASQRGAG